MQKEELKTGLGGRRGLKRHWHSSSQPLKWVGSPSKGGGGAERKRVMVKFGGTWTLTGEVERASLNETEIAVVGGKLGKKCVPKSKGGSMFPGRKGLVNCYQEIK